MTYKLTTKSNSLTISSKPNKLVTDVLIEKINVSLARTGGQGSQGRSVVNVAIVAGRLVFTFSDGTTTDVGAVPTIDSLAAVAFSGSLDDLNVGTLDQGTIIGGDYGN
jgi:hypothetical protein